MIRFCRLLLTPLIHSQLIPILWAMASILSDVSGESGDFGVFLYDFMSELVAKINRCVLIKTGDVI